MKPASPNVPFVSTITNSPPSLCSIEILFEESTLATMFVNPEPLIAPAITSASVAAPVVVIETVTAEFRAA